MKQLKLFVQLLFNKNYTAPISKWNKLVCYLCGRNNHKFNHNCNSGTVSNEKQQLLCAMVAKQNVRRQVIYSFTYLKFVFYVASSALFGNLLRWAVFISIIVVTDCYYCSSFHSMTCSRHWCVFDLLFLSLKFYYTVHGIVLCILYRYNQK